MPEVLEHSNQDLYFDGNDVKSYSAQQGDSVEAPPAIESSEPTESSETIALENQARTPEDELADQMLAGVVDSIKDLEVLALQTALTDTERSNLMGMAQIYEKESMDIRRRILEGEDMREETDQLREKISRQIELGKGQLHDAKEKESFRQGAEVAGRTAVAKYEARQEMAAAAEAAQNVISPQAEVAAVAPTSRTETAPPEKEISKRERELGVKYGRAAGLIQELLSSSAYKEMGENDPRVAELKDKIKHYQDLGRHQFEGNGRKPGLFGGMKEIDGTIDALQDALFARQYGKNPSLDKEAKKRYDKFTKSDNPFKKYV